MGGQTGGNDHGVSLTEAPNLEALAWRPWPSLASPD
jgi:hypothetical protein